MTTPETSIYVSPLVERNASRQMAELFGPKNRFRTWRQIWLELARAQMALGLPITQAQLDQMAAHLDDIDFEEAARLEHKLRHDVMAHIHAFAKVAPEAGPIIHLGATSCDITDNADLIILRDALRIVAAKVASVIDLLARFARRYRNMPTLAFTHYQPAQPTTVGKRAILWCQEFVLDLADLEYRIENLPFRGIKGATGTQASFLELFDGNHAKVKKLELMVARAFGFKRICPVTGQTYPRKIDTQIVNTLALVAQSAQKVCTDIRLLANLKEIEEPFERSQVGSSAMPYKRNPMRSERATALARLVLSLSTSPAMTACQQWFERTLDDSANRRVVLPEAFLAVDGILEIMLNVLDGLVVYPKVIHSHLAAELPFMATERIIMAAVRQGADRQKIHEIIRRHAQAAADQVKAEGKPNDLIERLKADPTFKDIDIDSLMDPGTFTGRSAQQVDEYIQQVVRPILRRYRKLLYKQSELKV